MYFLHRELLQRARLQFFIKISLEVTSLGFLCLDSEGKRQWKKQEKREKWEVTCRKKAAGWNQTEATCRKACLNPGLCLTRGSMWLCVAQNDITFAALPHCMVPFVQGNSCSPLKICNCLVEMCGRTTWRPNRNSGCLRWKTQASIWFNTQRPLW